MHSFEKIKKALAALDKEQPFVLTDSRRTLAQNISRFVHRLATKQLMSNSMHGLIVGTKGIGKSFFLKRLAVVLGSLFPKVIVVYNNFSTTLLPISRLIGAAARDRGIDITVKIQDDINAVLTKLIKHGYFAGICIETVADAKCLLEMTITKSFNVKIRSNWLMQTLFIDRLT